ncbi:hypothetical protein GCM10008942_20910 [Rhizomicrobium electricum]|uniref:Lipocalin-like domain-containing protein n=2 Tax=Rhizomicrobium electricum TaxID=480070 RepID=A0ABN1EQK1_9PROT
MGMTSVVRVVPFLALLVAGGCASEPAYQILTPFLDNDFQTWKKPGPYTVSGQAFYKVADGRVITCAGETVSLMPLTGYNMELSKLLESGKGYPPNYERRAHKYDHKALCDGDGRFSISGIPSLNWLLITRVSWQEDGTLSAVPLVGGPSNKGGWLYQEISIDGADMKVTLSNQDFVADKE